MAAACLIGCSPKFQAPPEGLDKDTLNLFDDDILSTSVFEEIVGSSQAICCVTAQVLRVAPSDATVPITGESGTGKELIARAIHRISNRSRRPFVCMNCAATPPSLIAADLFGHERGAFTGANQRRAGRFEVANHGTLFLDEIGDMPAEAQVSLLRVLQEREFERVGGNRSIRVDVRVIAATNCDLSTGVGSGEFRRDLVRNRCDQLGFEMNRCIAFGDSMSDYLLFKELEHTVSVNGDLTLRSFARYCYHGPDLYEALLQTCNELTPE